MRVRLLATVSVAAALTIVAVCTFVGAETARSIRGEAEAGALRAAEVFANVSLEADEFEDGRLTAEAVNDLEANLKATKGILGVRVWSADGRLAYNGGDGPVTAAPRARGREFHSTVVERAGVEMLRVDLPVVVAGGDGKRLATLEADVPYAPVRAEITKRTRRLYITLGSAGLLLYLALLPTFARVATLFDQSYARRRPRLQRQLRRAMERDELVLHYQPKFDLRTGAVTSVEALLRWQHPQLGTVAPGQFIPQAEPTPVMADLTMHVVGLAAEQSARWEDAGIDVEIAVNLGAKILSDPSLPWKLAEALEPSGIAPRRLRLEVTETAADDARARELLVPLQRMGFGLSIDDFGTGHSSLSRLSRLPVDEVKLDRSFLQAGEADDRVIAGVIRLAHELDMRVVAEGIEQAADLARLVEAGCDVGQGYRLARPMPVGDVTSRLREASLRARGGPPSA